MAAAERNRWKAFFISPPEEKKFGMLANALPFEWECPRFSYVVRFPGNSLQASLSGLDARGLTFSAAWRQTISQRCRHRRDACRGCVRRVLHPHAPRHARRSHRRARVLLAIDRQPSPGKT